MRSFADHNRWTILLWIVAVAWCNESAISLAADTAGGRVERADPYSWPTMTCTSKPWTYWYWMGGAVEESELSRHLELYNKAGFGGVHVIPVYGVRGAEQRYVPFLSPRWMELLAHTVREADRLGMGVDMTTGTGWPFGGPWVQPADAASHFVIEEFVPDDSLVVRDKIRSRDKRQITAEIVVLMGYGPGGEIRELTDQVNPAGQLDWRAPGPGWRLTALFQSPTHLPVERAAPGGEGLTVDHFSRAALEKYLRRFDEAFHGFDTLRVRSMYNDSYENWGENWTPKLFDEFEQRRGYDLRAQLPRLNETDSSDQARRVRADYRETLADLIRDDFATHWVDWAHERKMRVRNEGHGAPGNPLDLYGLADIPETEVFGTSWLETMGLEPLPGVPARHGGPPEMQVCKLASSAAHVAGRQLCSSETFTWLGDHFKIPLEHMKSQADLMFVMGVNHIFFHGAAYSPSDAAWPGWLWYASTNVGEYMPAWRNMPALCDYIARCQAWLQSGNPDNDVLVYFPIYDLWATDEGARNGMQYTTVHNSPVWLEKHLAGFADTGRTLWRRGYSFDCISDRQVVELTVADGALVGKGSKYRALIVPACNLMPEATLEQISRLLQEGATVVVSGQLPQDVPGWSHLEARRAKLRDAVQQLSKFQQGADAKDDRSENHGRLIVGDNVELLLDRAGVSREPMVDAGLKFVRRRDASGWFYFIVNHSGKRLEQWIPVATPSTDMVIFDPASGQSGKAATRRDGDTSECFIQLEPRQSLIVRALRDPSNGPNWKYQREQESRQLPGPWQVEFIEGGPALPKDVTIQELSDWTKWQGETQALQSFSGVARYVTEFEQPDRSADSWTLNLGGVCHSAQVRLNGNIVGTVITAPYQIDVTRALRRGSNRLEVEVANLPANRVADLDRRGEDWKKFLFVDIRYQPFDASQWPPVASGLIGPVRLSSHRHWNHDELVSLP